MIIHKEWTKKKKALTKTFKIRNRNKKKRKKKRVAFKEMTSTIKIIMIILCAYTWKNEQQKKESKGMEISSDNKTVCNKKFFFSLKRQHDKEVNENYL